VAITAEYLPELVARVRQHLIDTGDCWLVDHSLTAGGYARVWYRGKHWYCHIVMYEAVVGAIPTGLELDHRCRIRHCCNPDHLEPVTHVVNTMRGESPPARSARASVCVRGHVWDAETTYWRQHKDGRLTRQCRACARENDARRRAAR
jgi:hypothetical protein